MPAPLNEDAVAFLQQAGYPITTENLNRAMNALQENPQLRPSYGGGMPNDAGGIDAALARDGFSTEPSVTGRRAPATSSPAATSAQSSTATPTTATAPESPAEHAAETPVQEQAEGPVADEPVEAAMQKALAPAPDVNGISDPGSTSEADLAALAGTGGAAAIAKLVAEMRAQPSGPTGRVEPVFENAMAKAMAENELRVRTPPNARGVRDDVMPEGKPGVLVGESYDPDYKAPPPQGQIGQEKRLGLPAPDNMVERVGAPSHVSGLGVPVGEAVTDDSNTPRRPFKDESPRRIGQERRDALPPPGPRNPNQLPPPDNSVERVAPPIGQKSGPGVMIDKAISDDAVTPKRPVKDTSPKQITQEKRPQLTDQRDRDHNYDTANAPKRAPDTGASETVKAAQEHNRSIFQAMKDRLNFKAMTPEQQRAWKTLGRAGR